MNNFNFRSIFTLAPWRISITWFGVALENALIAILPLLIGFAIDGLLAGRFIELLMMLGVFSSIIVLATIRRIYDTRVYTKLRLEFGKLVDIAHSKQHVSTRNARLEMSRELIDFLEKDLPEFFTAMIQIVIAVIILFGFYVYLSLSALIAAMLILIIYRLFHKSFYRLNKKLNTQKEQQIVRLERRMLSRHLHILRILEIRLSDHEAWLFALVLLLLMLFLACNLWISAGLPDMTAGKIFAILSYTWEFIESILILPMMLQNLSRLTEITERLNKVD